ncbi:MAG: glycerol kinase GlpK [Gemmatimonadota bacterium]
MTAVRAAGASGQGGAVLAIDQGTTGTTCLVVDRSGQVTGRGYREITPHFPHPGWVEHDATEIFERTIAAARDALAQARAAGAAPPVCIGITNQRETIVLWDRATGVPVHRAIVWQDRRTAARCAELASHADTIRARTGLVVDPYFSATKLEWLLARPGVRERAERGELLAGTIDTWLVWKLTGGAVHATDHTNASRTMLYDIDRRAWCDELLALFSVPRGLLPDVRPSSGDFGNAQAKHIGVALPILGVAGDQQAALFGQGGWGVGTVKNTYGTGAFLLLNAGPVRPSPRGGILTTIACDATGAPVFALEAAIFIAGAAVQWLRDGLGIIDTAPETEPLARSLTGNDGVYFVPALVGLGAPDWEPDARGTIVGLTRGTTRAHLARAALEAMAYSTLDVLEDMRSSAGATLSAMRVDGGAASNDWLMQFQADVAGIEVERSDLVETTALGAAGLAGIAAGVWPDAATFTEARQFVRFSPGEARAAALAAHAGWRRAVRATLGWARDTG